jgi:hypothetical protein
VPEANLPQSLHAIQDWQLEVEQDHIRLKLRGKLDDLLTAGGFADYQEIRLGAEDREQPVSYHRVVVCN